MQFKDDLGLRLEDRFVQKSSFMQGSNFRAQLE